MKSYAVPSVVDNRLTLPQHPIQCCITDDLRHHNAMEWNPHHSQTHLRNQLMQCELMVVLCGCISLLLTERGWLIRRQRDVFPRIPSEIIALPQIGRTILPLSSASSTGPQGCKFDHQYIRFCTDGRSLDRFFLVHI